MLTYNSDTESDAEMQDILQQKEITNAAKVSVNTNSPDTVHMKSTQGLPSIIAVTHGFPENQPLTQRMSPEHSGTLHTNVKEFVPFNISSDFVFNPLPLPLAYK